MDASTCAMRGRPPGHRGHSSGKDACIRCPRSRPDAALSLNAEPGAQPATVVERQAIARTPIDTLAILWPLDLQSVDQAPPGAQAWLLLQVGALPEPVQR